MIWDSFLKYFLIYIEMYKLGFFNEECRKIENY